MAGQPGIMPAPKWLQTLQAELFHQYAGIAVAWEVVLAELSFAVTVEERFAIVHRFFLQCFDLGGGEYVFALAVGDLGDFLHYAFVECASLFQIAVKRRALQQALAEVFLRADMRYRRGHGGQWQTEEEGGDEFFH